MSLHYMRNPKDFIERVEIFHPKNHIFRTLKLPRANDLRRAFSNRSPFSLILSRSVSSYEGASPGRVGAYRRSVSRDASQSEKILKYIFSRGPRFKKTVVVSVRKMEAGVSLRVNPRLDFIRFYSFFSFFVFSFLLFFFFVFICFSRLIFLFFICFFVFLFLFVFGV